MTDLSAIKHDQKRLLEVLSLPRAGNHGPCRFCGSSDALSVFGSESGWAFRCHSCGEAGSIIDALAFVEGITIADSLRRLTGNQAYVRSSKPIAIKQTAIQEPITPTPDHARLSHFLAEARKTLANDREVQARFMQGKRGLALNTCQSLGLGFMREIFFKEWPSWRLENAWVLPVSDHKTGEPVAAKLHFESPPPKSPKSLWTPFGIDTDASTGKTRNGFATLWPWPECGAFAERTAIYQVEGHLTLEDARRRAGAECGFVHVTEGELKAAAILCAGLDAVSPTAGASFRWTPALVERLRYRRVRIVFDDDQAGHEFKDKAAAALCGVALEIREKTFGRKGVA